LEGGNSGVSLPPEATVDAQGKVRLLPGFELIGGRIDNARGLEQRVYSDGLATVSVYIEQRQGSETGGEFATRRGAVQLYGRQTGATRVVAVGAVPPESTKRLVDATFESLVAAK
jgi:negative regulator of sigma E activity